MFVKATILFLHSELNIHTQQFSTVANTWVMGVFIQRNGTVEWNDGMERWNGMEWNDHA